MFKKPRYVIHIYIYLSIYYIHAYIYIYIYIFVYTALHVPIRVYQYLCSQVVTYVSNGTASKYE